MAIDNRREAIEEILKMADVLFRRLLPSVPPELLELDITMPQLKIMIILYVRGPQRMSDLASNLSVTLATATGLVDKLVERDYIVRDSTMEDRRVVLCRLSAEGNKTISNIWDSARRHSRELLEAMDAGHLDMFIDVLKEMLKTATPGQVTAK
jgi:DNA-binding MarR family transcriptional regulator